MSSRARLLVALTSTLVIGYVFVGTLLGRVMGDTSYGQLAVFNEVVRLVIEAYVEPVNLDRAMAGARLGMTEALDGDSAYLDDEEFRLYQQAPKESDADIGLVITRRLGFLMAVGTRPGSPAAKAGIRPGDIVKSIDGRYARPLAAPTGERLLRGAPGSTLKLVTSRGGEPIELQLTRERLGATSPKGRLLEDGSGHLTVPEFLPRVAEEVRTEVEALRKAGAVRLVLDLRGASFGDPAEGARVAELFVKGGLAAKLVSRGGEQALPAEARRMIWEGPLVLLVDNGTSGGAEIVAAAILDAARAELVGQHTFGRAAVQKAVPLPEGGLVLTTARYASPNGTVLHGKGLKPTVAVVPDRDEDPADASRDLFLEKALEVLRDQPQKKAA